MVLLNCVGIAAGSVDVEKQVNMGSWDNNRFRGSLGDGGRLLCNVYGMEEAALSRMDIQEGETDAHVLYDKMADGQGVLVGVDTNWSTKTINKDFSDSGRKDNRYL